MKKKTVTMYTCGPTVYGRPHIGNYSSFLMADLLRRWLEAGHGWKVVHAKNITDVGHLVRDRDEGEDKIEKQAREEFGAVNHETVINVARSYEAQYLEDEKTLNMIEPEHRPRATAYIDQMKEMIEELLEKGIAYTTSDGIYFDVSQFSHYGHLSGNTLENLSVGVRIDVNEEKKHPADFALWKFCVGPNEHHALRWPSPVVKNDVTPPARPKPDGEGGSTVEGFPGWHIECSAMSRALLGDTIDLHTGGEDNIFPHHECEIAQSESVTGKTPFVRFWLHKRRIDLEGEKMSKSLGNVLSIPDIVAKGYDAQDIRYYLLSVHYRTNLKFSWKGMDDAKIARKKITEWISDVNGDHEVDKNSSVAIAEKYQREFSDAMNADMNTSAALGSVFSAMADFRKNKPFSKDEYKRWKEYVQLVQKTFGCFEQSAEVSVPENIQSLVDERARARVEKNFAESDRLRDAIAELGYEVRDNGAEQVVKKR